MDDFKHKKIHTNGTWMHISEKGEGPLVLLVHGFPEFWYSWRYQITHLANAGYHVVAPDMRGYGDTDSPVHPTSYTAVHLVADLIGLLDHFGAQQAYVVGHDWGATAAWHLALLKPDRVRGLVALGAPYWPRSPSSKPVESLRKAFGDWLYISQFQEPGRAEKAFARYETATVMKKFLLITDDRLLISPPDMELIDWLETPSELPPWIIEGELQVYANKFEESGFTGGLNYYRAMDLSWEFLAPWQGSKICVPTKFIVGDKDIGFQNFGTKRYIESEDFKSLVPDLEVVIISDGHHFIQQEKAAEVTKEILSFICKMSCNHQHVE